MMVGHDRLTQDGKAFFAEIEKLKKVQIRVGYQDDNKKAARRNDKGKIEESDTKILDVAMWNELGTAGAHPIPERPFMRDSVDKNADKITSFCQAQLRKIAQGGTTEQCCQNIGVMQKGLIQKTIRDGAFAPNAEVTIKGGWLRTKTGKLIYIRGKKSDHPLINTGRLQQSVSYFIVPKGERK